MTTPVTLEQLIKDADDNFVTGRHADAAQEFGYIAEKLTREDEIVDAIYFYYRSILSFKNIGFDQQLVSKFRSLAVACLRKAVEINMKILQETTDPFEQEEILYKTLEQFSYLNDDQGRSKIIASLFDQYHKLVSKNGIPFEKMQNLMHRYTKLAETTNNQIELKNSKSQYVRLIYKEYRQTEPLEDPSESVKHKRQLKNIQKKIDRVSKEEEKHLSPKLKEIEKLIKKRRMNVTQVFKAATSLIKAASICLELNDEELCKNCIQVVLNLNFSEDEIKDFKWSEHGLPVIKSEKELETFLQGHFTKNQRNEQSNQLLSRIIINGESILKERISKDNQSPLVRIKNLIDRLTSKDKWRSSNISVVLYDSSLEDLNNPNLLEYFNELGSLVILPKGEDISHFLMEFASGTNGIVISNSKEIEKIDNKINFRTHNQEFMD